MAVRHECPAIALTDTGNLHGAAEFFAAANTAGVRPILGVELRHEGHPLLLYVESQGGYANLCRLLSRHAARPGDDEASVAAQQRRVFLRREFDGLTDGLVAVSQDSKLAELFPGRFYLIASCESKDGDLPVVACPAILQAVKLHGLEGVVAKRLDSKYRAGERSKSWLKLPLKPGQDFVIGAYRLDGKRLELLLVGYPPIRLYAHFTARHAA